jgi:ABC-type glycerol-3-phosphate transport system permease component
MRRSRASTVVPYVVLAAVAAVYLLPIWLLVVTSLRSPIAGVFKDWFPFRIEAFVPYELHLENYLKLLTPVADGRTGVSPDYGRGLVNSILIAGTTVVLGTLINAMAAFAFSRYSFPGRGILFALVAASFLVPFEAIVIPLYTIVNGLGLTNTYFALILPAVANGIAIFVFRQFFLGVPNDLFEAALLDGASIWQVIWRVYLPLTKPAFIASGIVLFLGQWQAYFWPLVIVRDHSMWTAQLAVATISGMVRDQPPDFGGMFASAVVTLVIPMILVLPLQRHFQVAFFIGGTHQ